MDRRSDLFQRSEAQDSLFDLPPNADYIELKHGDRITEANEFADAHEDVFRFNSTDMHSFSLGAKLATAILLSNAFLRDLTYILTQIHSTNQDCVVRNAGDMDRIRRIVRGGFEVDTSPAHDTEAYEFVLRHDLAIRKIFLNSLLVSEARNSGIRDIPHLVPKINLRQKQRQFAYS